MYECTALRSLAGCELQLCLKGVNGAFAYILDTFLIDFDLRDRDDDFPSKLVREKVVSLLCFGAEGAQGQAAARLRTEGISIEIEKVARVISALVGNHKGGLSLWAVGLVDAATSGEIEVEARLGIAFVLLRSENGRTCGKQRYAAQASQDPSYRHGGPLSLEWRVV